MLEKECLETLNKNFECICKKKKKNHFPTFLRIDENDYIYMTYCGVNIKTYHEMGGVRLIFKIRKQLIK